MRICCCLTLLLASVTITAAQNEPCLAGTDTPECGIKVTMTPALNPDEHVLWVPNEITVDVPLRLHAAKVGVLSSPAGAASAEAFKPVAETKNYKKVEGNARFKVPVKECPGSDTVLAINIYSPRFPYPLTVNVQPIQCKPGASK